jgi:hypothetical protein
MAVENGDYVAEEDVFVLEGGKRVDRGVPGAMLVCTKGTRMKAEVAAAYGLLTDKQAERAASTAAKEQTA